MVGRKDSDDSKYYYHGDHLGGTHVVTDEDGNLDERSRYYPFGKEFTSNSPDPGYTGHRYDADTGLNYMVNRYYQPEIRRFTSPDPIIQDYYNPQNLNRYSYTLNNPLIYIDPTGHIALTIDITLNIGLGADLTFSYGKAYAISNSGKITQGVFASSGKGISSPTGSLGIRIIGYKNVQEVGELGGKTNELSLDFTASQTPIISGPASGGGVMVWQNDVTESSLTETFKTCIETEPEGLGVSIAADVNSPISVSAGFTEVDTIVLETPTINNPEYDVHGSYIGDILKEYLTGNSMKDDDEDD
ncbi:MAG: RHS repeat-associated core domain-containing protein [Candidatus Altiarchaeota archaeon]